jgi:hypothetical protein
MYGCAAYIPDMSRDDSKRARHRQRQAAYEARLRDRIGFFPTFMLARTVATEVRFEERVNQPNGS